MIICYRGVIKGWNSIMSESGSPEAYFVVKYAYEVAAVSGFQLL